jgi:hypothetical protein
MDTNAGGEKWASGKLNLKESALIWITLYITISESQTKYKTNKQTNKR